MEPDEDPVAMNVDCDKRRAEDEDLDRMMAVLLDQALNDEQQGEDDVMEFVETEERPRKRLRRDTGDTQVVVPPREPEPVQTPIVETEITPEHSDYEFLVYVAANHTEFPNSFLGEIPMSLEQRPFTKERHEWIQKCLEEAASSGSIKEGHLCSFGKPPTIDVRGYFRDHVRKFMKSTWMSDPHRPIYLPDDWELLDGGNSFDWKVCEGILSGKIAGDGRYNHYGESRTDRAFEYINHYFGYVMDSGDYVCRYYDCIEKRPMLIYKSATAFKDMVDHYTYKFEAFAPSAAPRGPGARDPESPETVAQPLMKKVTLRPLRSWMQWHKKTTFQQKCCSPTHYDALRGVSDTTSDDHEKWAEHAVDPSEQRVLNVFEGWGIDKNYVLAFKRLYWDWAIKGEPRFLTNGVYTRKISLGSLPPTISAIGSFSLWFSTPWDEQTRRFGLTAGKMYTRHYAPESSKMVYVEGCPNTQDPNWKNHIPWLSRLNDDELFPEWYALLSKHADKALHDESVARDFYQNFLDGLVEGAERPDFEDWRQFDTFYSWFSSDTDPFKLCGLSIAPFLQFVYLHVCRSNWDAYRALMDFAFNIMERPDTPCPAAFAFHGSGGSGKSLFCLVLISLVGYRHSMVTANPKDIVGDFTDLASKILVFLDECSIPRKDKSFQEFKNLVTGTVSRTRVMHKMPKYDKRLARIMFASENRDMLPAEIGERRIFFNNYDPRVAKRTKYLSSIFNLMHGTGEFKPTDKRPSGTIPDVGYGCILFYDYIKEWPFRSWEIRQPINNDLLAERKVESAGPIVSWMHTILSRGHHIDFRVLMAHMPPMWEVRKQCLKKMLGGKISDTDAGLFVSLQEREAASLGPAEMDFLTQCFKKTHLGVELSWIVAFPKEWLYHLFVRETSAKAVPQTTFWTQVYNILKGWVPKDARFHKPIDTANELPPTRNFTSYQVSKGRWIVDFPDLEAARAMFCRFIGWETFNDLSGDGGLDRRSDGSLMYFFRNEYINDD